MEFYHAELLLEFDAAYAWTSRDRVIVKQMTAHLARVAKRFAQKICGNEKNEDGAGGTCGTVCGDASKA